MNRADDMSNRDHTSMWVRVTVATLAAGAVLAFATPAHAAEALVVSPSSVRGGATVTVSGSGWTCNGDIDIYLAPAGDAALLVDMVPYGDHAAGSFQLRVVAPNGAGRYDVTASYDSAASSSGCVGQAGASFTVIAAPTPSTSTTTPSNSTSTSTTISTTTTTLAPTTSASSSTTLAPTTTTGVTTTSLADSSGATTTSLADSSGATTTAAPAASTTLVGNAGGAATTTLALGPTGQLPVTGNSSYSVVPYALVIAALGGLLVLATRRQPA
jgi:hypothetical protein